jgi:hypothetical protein
MNRTPSLHRAEARSACVCHVREMHKLTNNADPASGGARRPRPRGNRPIGLFRPVIAPNASTPTTSSNADNPATPGGGLDTHSPPAIPARV